MPQYPRQTNRPCNWKAGYADYCALEETRTLMCSLYRRFPRPGRIEPFDMLIGNDLLWRIGELNINYATRRLTLRDHNTKFAYSFNLEPTTVDTIIVPSDANQETFWAGGSDPPNTTQATQPTTQKHYHRLRTPSTGGTGISDETADGRRRRAQSLSPALLPTSPKQLTMRDLAFPMASYQTPARNSSIPWQLTDMNTPRSPWTPGGPMSTNRPVQGLPKPPSSEGSRSNLCHTSSQHPEITCCA